MSIGSTPSACAVEACPDENVILEFVEGSSSRVDRAALERHFDTCEDCHDLVAALIQSPASPERGADDPSGHEDTLRPELGSEPTLAASPASKPWAPLPGDAPARLGRYLVIEVLGAGGMGVVYAAYDPELDRKIAVKVLRTGRGGQDETKRLIQEARAMARLSHANVVGVYDVGTFGDDVFVAMEYVAGVNLSAWQRSEKQRWREVLEVYKQAARGLAAAHRAGLVHRDFKPHNAMIAEDGVVKVLDFGLARLVDTKPATDLVDTDPHKRTPSETRLITRTGAVMGTPAYMSPEQFEGQRADARSDQFSFCVSLFQALYGQLPFAGDSFSALFHNVIHGKLRPIDEHADVPLWIRAVVLRGLEVDANARYPDMETLLAALEQNPALIRHRRRTRVAVGAAIVATGLGTAAASGAWRRPCAGVDDELAAVWTDARRESTGRAVLSSGVAFAAETWPRVAPVLDEYADSWVRARRDSCRAHSDRRISEQLYDRQTACLDQRRASLDTFVNILEQTADGDVVGRAAIAARKLPMITLCVDADYLSSTVPHPEREETAAAVAAGRKKLASAAEYESLGRYSKAIELAELVRSAAEDAAYEPLAAEAQLRAGSAYMMRFEGRAAKTALTHALWRGMRSAHDPVAAEAAIKRLYSRAELLGDINGAQTDQPLAEALVTRVDDPRLHSLYFNNLAIARERAGEDKEAAAAYDAALRIAGARLSSNDPDVLIVLANYGALLTTMWRYAEGREKLERALELGHAILGRDHPQVAVVEVMLAHALVWRGEYTKADEFLAHAESVQLVDAPARFYTHTEQGYLALHQRRYDRALEYFQRALDDARIAEFDAVTIADTLHGAGDALMGLTRPHETGASSSIERGLAYHERALRAREEALGAESGLVGESCRRLGRAYLQAPWPDSVERAKELLNRAQLIIEYNDDPHTPGTALTLMDLALVYQKLGELDASERAFSRALELLEDLTPGEPVSPWLLKARVQYAAILHELGRYDDALDQIEFALSRFTWPLDAAYARYERAKILGTRDGCSSAVREDANAARAVLAGESQPHVDVAREINTWAEGLCAGV